MSLKHIAFRLFVCLFVFGLTASNGPGPPYSRGFKITHNDAPQSVGLARRMTSSSQKSLPNNIQHSQQTNIHARCEIRTRNLSRRTAVELRLNGVATGTGTLRLVAQKNTH